MKKIICILACMMMVMCFLSACSDDANSTPTVSPDVIEDIAEQNPLFIRMGDEITINGKTYTAAMLYDNIFDNVLINDEGTFVVNRITGCVYLRTSSSTYRGSCVIAWLDTGLTYEGTVNVAGVEISIPENPN